MSQCLLITKTIDKDGEITVILRRWQLQFHVTISTHFISVFSLGFMVSREKEINASLQRPVVADDNLFNRWFFNEDNLRSDSKGRKMLYSAICKKENNKQLTMWRNKSNLHNH